MSDGRVVWCLVEGREIGRVPAYLPRGWEVVDADETGLDGDSCIVRGVELAGWTFVDYVQPRLASGSLWADELEESEALELERIYQGAVAS